MFKLIDWANSVVVCESVPQRTMQGRKETALCRLAVALGAALPKLEALAIATGDTDATRAVDELRAMLDADDV